MRGPLAAKIKNGLKKMAWIYLPKTLYQYKCENRYESRFDRYRPSHKQKRIRYWKLVHTFWLFTFLIFCITMAKVSMGVIGPRHFDWLGVEIPDAKSAYLIADGPYLKIWINEKNVIVIDGETIFNYDQLAHMIYNSYYKSPRPKLLIIADKNTDMDAIHYISKVAKIAGYNEVYYKCFIII